MTTPTPPVPAAPAQPHGFTAWVEEHFVPGLKTVLADAEKAREVIPEVQAFLPKLVALGPLIAEAGQILAAIAAL